MATFYLLPPRPLLARRYADFLGAFFPGLDWSRVPWADLAEAVGGLAACQPDVYVVFREDLPDGAAQAEVLKEDFGAEAGDEVVEVRAGHPQETARRWVLS